MILITLMMEALILNVTSVLTRATWRKNLKSYMTLTGLDLERIGNVSFEVRTAFFYPRSHTA
jgi:hypothetical protein